VGRIDFDALEALPQDTLGREYVRFLRTVGLDPNALPVRPAANDDAYALAHLYETHDIWHTVLGFDSSVSGEFGLLAFYFAQFPGRLSPMLLSAGLMNTATKRIDEKDQRMDAIVRGWLLGKRTPPLFGETRTSPDSPAAAIHPYPQTDKRPLSSLPLSTLVCPARAMLPSRWHALSAMWRHHGAALRRHAACHLPSARRTRQVRSERTAGGRHAPLKPTETTGVARTRADEDAYAIGFQQIQAP
jgi:hypothetical protein